MWCVAEEEGLLADGRVITTEGSISPEDLGITLTHEHILCDLRCWHVLPEDLTRRARATEPLTMDMLGDVRRDALAFRDNLVLDDPELMCTELEEFTRLGGKTLVELTLNGLEPRIGEIRDIGRRVGLNVIVGCGFYVQSSHPPEVAARSYHSLVDHFLTEIAHGVGGSGIRPGVIGEIGTSQPVHPDEWKVLDAACEAQTKTGLPLFVHPYPITPEACTAYGVAKHVIDQGVAPERLNMCHMDTYFDMATLRKVADLGVFISFDTFGTEVYFDSIGGYRIHDSERERLLIQLIEEGYADQLLISQDICIKALLKRYGGYGYGHILKNVVPSLRRRGVDESNIRRILVDNPRRILTVPR